MSDSAVLGERVQRIHERLRTQSGAAETDLLPADVWLRAAQSDTRLQVSPTPADDPLLSGAFASLDRETGAIWFAEDLLPPRRRAILAHEFGHFYLHPDLLTDSCDECDAPDSLFSNVAQTAVGYSPAERRESEANRFAAEFLLPAAALRHAFLAQNLPASEIAARVGVSESLTLSRLAEALLLSNPKSEADVGQSVSQSEIQNPKLKIDPGLDSSQKIAAEMLTGPILVDAGPGTGKTRTLIARLRFLIEMRGVLPDNILALTFSNKAADEMRTRLAETVGEASSRVWIGTFHAFGLEFLRKEGAVLGLPPAPALLEPGDAALLLEQNLDRLDLDAYLYLSQPALPFPDILACISRAKDELQTPDAYRQAALVLLETDKDAGAKAREIAEIYAVYQRILAERGLLDFGDLLMRSVELLDTSPAVRQRWQAQYPHLLADEYQDVNRASAEMLKRLAGTGDGFWAVGDARQAIYQFRGASPANIRDFERDFPGGKRLRLGVNYRSRPGIVGLFTSAAPTTPSQSPPSQGKGEKSASFALQEGGEPSSASPYEGGDRGAVLWQTQRESSHEAEQEIVFAEADDEEAQADGVAAEIRRREGGGTALREQALLCRTNRQAGEWAQWLQARNVPAQHFGDMFDRNETKDLLSLLQLACEPHGATLRRVAQFPAYNIPDADVSNLTRAAIECATPFPKALSLAAELPECSEMGKRGFAQLWRDIQPIAHRGDAWAFLSRYLFQTTAYLRPLLMEETFASQQKLRTIRRLLAFTQSICGKMRFVEGEAGQSEFLAHLRHLLLCGEERSARLPDDADDINAVRLLTAHSSKGLEFPVVYLPNLTERQFPGPKRGRMASPPPFLDGNGDAKPDEPDSDASLFFVALSRARDALILSYPKIRNGKPEKVSSLLKPLQIALNSNTVNRVYWRTGFRPVHTEATAEASCLPPPASLPASCSASALEEYEQCPRRFYYRRVLQIKTGPDDSDYLRFHEATAKTAEWIAIQRFTGISPTEQETQEKLAEVWMQAEEETAVTRLLRRKAAQMVETLRQNPVPNQAAPTERKFTANLEHGSVTVECDAATKTADGVLHLDRHIKRRLKSDDHTERRLALLRKAAQQTNAPRVEIALVSLADGETKPVPEAPRYEPARVEKYDAALAGIGAERFEPKPAERECPRCPYFFLCPS